MDRHYLFEMLNDHPDNIEKINATLHDIKNSLCGHLYTAQRALSMFHRVDLDFSDHRQIRHNRIVFDVAYTYIENENRCDFRNSEFYKREIHCDDIFKNPEIFSRVILVFIDGRLTNNFYAFFAEDRVEIRFVRHMKTPNTSEDGMYRGTIDELVETGAKITIIFMPICKKASGIVPYMRISDDMFTISEQAEYLTGSSYVNAGTEPMMFLAGEINGYNGTGITYQNMRYSKTDNGLSIASDTYPNFVYQYFNPDIYMNIIYPANLITIKDVASDGWFTLPLMRMPIPKENILVFRKSSLENDSAMELDHTAIIDMYYPNVYKVKSDYNGEFTIYVFYNDNIEYSELLHYNEIDLYMRFMDHFTEYTDNTIPKYIKSFEPVTLEYNINNYIASGESHLEYKIGKLRDVIYKNPALYKYYLKRYVDRYPNVELEIDPDEYSSRLRRDTSIELPNMDIVTFDSPRYMFSMRRCSNLQFFKFFIDRKAYHPSEDEMFYDNEFVYLYLPTSVVMLDSHIEIHKLYNSSFSDTYTVPDEPIHIHLDESRRATVEDLYVTHNTGEIEEYVTNYKVYERLDDSRLSLDGDIEIDGHRYREINITKFYKYSDIYFVFDESLVGETVTIRSDKRTVIYRNFDEFIEIDENVNKDKRNYLTYRDGRLMSPKATKFRYNQDSDGTHTIQPLIVTEEDTSVIVSHLPDKYNLVCDYADPYVKRLRIYQKYMDAGDDISGRDGNIYDMQLASSKELRDKISETGHFVDLTNLITKPLDFRWYEIYMNGLKLTEKDVIFISPYQMIITLQDDYPDIDSFIITDMLGFIEEYTIPLPFINPDWVQVTDAMIEEYPEVMDAHENVIFDGDTLYTMPGSILLNPDIAEGYTIEGVV